MGSTFAGTKDTAVNGQEIKLLILRAESIDIKYLLLFSLPVLPKKASPLQAWSSKKADVTNRVSQGWLRAPRFW